MSKITLQQRIEGLERDLRALQEKVDLANTKSNSNAARIAHLEHQGVRHPLPDTIRFV